MWAVLEPWPRYTYLGYRGWGLGYRKNMLTSYKQLLVWQKAVEFVVDVYRITKMFPKEELFGLTSQVRRAAVSIPASIAEGYSRKHTKEYIQFLRIAFGSGAEEETHLLIACKIGYLNQKDYNYLILKL